MKQKKRERGHEREGGFLLRSLLYFVKIKLWVHLKIPFKPQRKKVKQQLSAVSLGIGLQQQRWRARSPPRRRSPTNARRSNSTSTFSPPSSPQTMSLKPKSSSTTVAFSHSSSSLFFSSFSRFFIFGYWYCMFSVLSDDVALVVSRQLLQAFAQELGRLEPEFQKEISHYTLNQIQPRVVSFEEQVSFQTNLCFFLSLLDWLCCLFRHVLRFGLYEVCILCWSWVQVCREKW